jgi:hypothetical protein
VADDSKTAWRGAFIGHVTAGRVRRARRSARRERFGRVEPERANVLVTDAIDEFLEAAERGYPPDVLRELHWSLGGHVREELGGMRLIDMSRDDVEALIDELSGAGISRRRLRALVNSLRALYDYAIDRGLVQHNPAERVAFPYDEAADDEASRVPSRPKLAVADWAISLGLRLATVGFVLLALFLIAESL